MTAMDRVTLLDRAYALLKFEGETRLQFCVRMQAALEAEGHQMNAEVRG